MEEQDRVFNICVLRLFVGELASRGVCVQVDEAALNPIIDWRPRLDACCGCGRLSVLVHGVYLFLIDFCDLEHGLSDFTDLVLRTMREEADEHV